MEKFKLYMVICVYMNMYISVIYMIYLLSSPYLRVFGDDRVRGTREHMLMMQVVLVQLSRGEGFDLGKILCYLLLLKTVVNPDG